MLIDLTLQRSHHVDLFFRLFPTSRTDRASVANHVARSRAIKDDESRLGRKVDAGGRRVEAIEGEWD